MKKLLPLLLALITHFSYAQKQNTSSERGGDHGTDWIEVSYFDFNGVGYASARSEDVGAGCYLNLPAEPTSFASLHRAGENLIIEATDMSTTTFNIVGNDFASSFDDPVNLLYKRNDAGEYRGAPAADYTSLNLDQDCAIGGFVGANAPVGANLQLSDFTLGGVRTGYRTGYYNNQRTIYYYAWNRLDISYGTYDENRFQINNIPDNYRNGDYILFTDNNGSGFTNRGRRHHTDFEGPVGINNIVGKISIGQIVEKVGSSVIIQIFYTNFSGDFTHQLYHREVYTQEDSDGDGVINYLDIFPNDSTESVDTDNDGIGDNSDPLPHLSLSNNQTESLLGNISSVYQGYLYIEGNINIDNSEDVVIAYAGGGSTVTARRVGVETNPTTGVVTTRFERAPDAVISQSRWDAFLAIEGLTGQRAYRINTTN